MRGKKIFIAGVAMSLALAVALGGVLVHNNVKSKAGVDDGSITKSVLQEVYDSDNTINDEMSIETLCEMSDNELEETLSKCSIDESKEEYELCMAIEQGIYIDERGNEFFIVDNEVILNEDDLATGGIEDVIKDAQNKINKAKKLLEKKGKKAAQSALKVAWKAAASAVEFKYPCAAKLIKNSVDNKAYKETTKTKKKIFTSKIKKDSYYKNHIKSLKFTSKVKKTSFAFDSGDLFYALHNVDCHTSKKNKKVKVKITDTFDFKKEEYSIDRAFVTSVNNWAWLCQNADVLNEIKVEIEFNK